jgi:AraC-like DNA-binding protein
MIIATHPPRHPLNQFVDVLWFHEGLTTNHWLERVLPDGSMELIINLRDEARHVFHRATHRPLQSYRRSWLSGPHSQFIVIDTVPNASMIGAHFKPGGASAFFDVPLSELRNGVVDLESLWGGSAHTLREQLLHATSPAFKFRILEDALLARRELASSHPAVRHALTHLTQRPDVARIGELVGEIGLSPRHFIALFVQQVGLTPKVFCRVRRFQRVLRAIEQKRELAWANVAIDAGYYDQAHLINDFGEFCGMSPGEYLRQSPAYPNFIPL